MKLNDHFRKFIGNISLGPSREERITSALSNWEEKFSEDIELKDKFKDFFPQGSYSTNTTIKPMKENEYDIDAVLLLNINENESPKDTLYWIRDRIISHKYFQKATKVKNRCVRIDYANDFHVDVVPALPYEDIIKIPSKKENSWSKNNPVGFTKWCNDININSEHYYSKIVKIVKYWRDNKVGEETAPKSILLSTIIGHKLQKMPSIAETLVETLRELINYLEDIIDTQNIFIGNPSLPEENIARDWDIENANRFFMKIKSFYTDAYFALKEENTELSIQKWQEIFDDIAFPTTLGEGYNMANKIEQGEISVKPDGELTQGKGTKIKQHRFYGGI